MKLRSTILFGFLMLMVSGALKIPRNFRKILISFFYFHSCIIVASIWRQSQR